MIFWFTLKSIIFDRNCGDTVQKTCFLTLLTPFDLLDLVHSALEDVALFGLNAETGNVAHVG